MNYKNATASSALSALTIHPHDLQVYETLLKIGERPVTLIAKRASLGRTYTYKVLERLMRKGLVYEVERSGVRWFGPVGPARLMDMFFSAQTNLANQRPALKELILSLELLQDRHTGRPKINFFRGIEGVKEVYEYALRTAKKEIRAIGDYAHFFPKRLGKELHAWLWKYATRRAKRGILFRGIINQSSDSDRAHRSKALQLREMKMLKKVHLPVEVMIFGDSVAIMSSSGEQIGIIIENREIAVTLKNFFDAVWPLLPSYTLQKNSRVRTRRL